MTQSDQKTDYQDVSQMEKEELKEWCNSKKIDYEKSPLDKQIEWAIGKVYEYLQIHPRENEVHIRRLHYWLGSREPLFPCQIINRAWGKIACFVDNEGYGWRSYQLETKYNVQLGNALTEARYRKLIDWKLIIDNRNPEIIHEWYQRNQEIDIKYTINENFYINTRNPPSIHDLGFKSWDIPDNPLKTFYNELHSNTDEKIEVFKYLEYIKNINPDIFIYNGANNLNIYYIAFAIEKTTLENQFRELCKNYAIDFFPGQGFVSTTRIFEMCEKAEKTGKPLLVLYLADLDKQGEAMTNSMPININRAYPRPNNKVIRIGINEDQVIKYNLPRETIEGHKKTELDALDSNVEEAFIKYTKRAYKIRKARNNRMIIIQTKMEKIDSIRESSELEEYQEDMENWVEEYNILKQKERKFRKRFTKYIWKPVEKKLKETINNYSKYLNSFNELTLENPDKETLENIQKNIEDSFFELFDEHVKKFHIEKVT